MKKIISLVLFALLVQPSFANDWFPQQPPQKEVKPKVGDSIPIPKTVDPQTKQSPAVILRQPCDRADKMFETLRKYEEHLLFVGKVYPFFLFPIRVFCAILTNLFIILLHFLLLNHLLDIFQNKQK